MPEKKHEVLKTIRESALVKNPVLFESIGIAPVVAMAVSLKSSIILSAVSIVELIVIELFACLCLKKLRSCLRVPIYALLGTLINIPLFIFFNKFAPNETSNVGIVLPLLAVNSLIALHCERFAVKNTAKNTFVDAISAGAGYTLVMIFVGLVREILGKGTIYGIALPLPVQLKGMLMPFGGFLMLGFMAAALKAIIAKKYPEAHPEKSFDMSEIQETHLSNLQDLMEDEFNPYDEDETGLEEIKSKKKKEKTEHEKQIKIRLPKKEPKKTEKQKKAKKQKPAKKKKTASASTRAVPIANRVQEDYLADFDEILADLEKYKEQRNASEGKENLPDEEAGNGGENK